MKVWIILVDSGVIFDEMKSIYRNGGGAIK